MAEDLGVECALPADWKDLFLRRGPNDRRLPPGEGYPDRVVVFQELTELHDAVTRALERVEPSFLERREEWRFDGYLPTNADSLLFMLVAHENVHLGQLGCWRRRFGLPSAMAAMARGPAA